MGIKDLPPKDAALVEALTEIARVECHEHSWEEVEPMLASCWNDSHRFQPAAMSWQTIAPYIQAACERPRTRRCVDVQRRARG